MGTTYGQAEGSGGSVRSMPGLSVLFRFSTFVVNRVQALIEVKSIEMVWVEIY